MKNWLPVVGLLIFAGCGGGGSAVNPIAWWRGEGNALDSAGNANGTPHGNVTYAPGVMGQAFQFDGVDSGINVPDAPQLRLTGSFTIDAWVKVIALPPAAQGGGMVLFRGDDRGGLDPYYVAVNFDGKIRFHIEDVAGNDADLEAPIAVGQFVHVTASLDAATGTMRLKLDGAVAAQMSTAIRPFQDLDPASNPGAGIGNHGGFPTTTYNYPFNGLIDELKVYNVAL